MNRLNGLRNGLLTGLVALTLGLAHLQLIRGAAYRELAEGNRLRLVPEPGPRGLIVDRRGRVLAANHTVFQVALIPQEVEDLPAVLAAVGAIVHRPVETLQQAFERSRGVAFLPATIIPRVSKDVALRLEEQQWRLPGLLVRPQTLRSYPQGSVASHVVGYLSQPAPEELPLLKPYGIRPQELIGRTGVEQLLDHALRGRTGGLIVEVNHRGRQIRVLGSRAAESGSTVTLTIDAELQAVVTSAFGSQPGAAVVLEPNTGEVLAMVSVPTFAPEAFSGSDPQLAQRFLSDPSAPLMNRATVGVYPAGSIMKLVTAAAALEQHVITPSTTIACPGALTIGDRSFHCWNRDGHGPMTLQHALMQSCNIYFMQVARRLGQTRLRAAMEQVGYSRRTGWPLEEQPGHVPQRRLSEGETALLAIGQGEILITPLQAAVVASVFATSGRLVHPWMVRGVADRSVAPSPSSDRVSWRPETFQAIREGMIAVVRDPWGTGHGAASRLVSIAGKTGTAQTGQSGHTHGWFIGFCPVEQPRAAMAIVAEYGGSGGERPASIAKAICEYLRTFAGATVLQPPADP